MLTQEPVFLSLWCHHNLNQATHSQLSRFLGGISMSALEHITNMGIAHRVQDNAGQNLVTAENLERLRGTPIFLFSGAENNVYSPETTEMSYNVLRDALNEEDYERVVFPGKGHLDSWMAVDAYKDVYPRVFAHVLKVTAKG